MNLPNSYLDLPVFSSILGIAGSGKTTLGRQLRDNSEGRVLLCSTTGVSAVNLGDATTINSLLWYFDTADLKDSYVSGKIDFCLRRLWKVGVRRLFLDEVSMMDAAQLTIITRAVREFNFRVEEPLGLTVSGDFCQLCPVKGKFAFESEEWEEYEKAMLLLTEVRRQSDRDFLLALNHVRRGDGEKAIEFFRPLLNQKLDDHFQGTTVFAKNLEVDRFNQVRMDKLKTKTVEFKTERIGKQKGHWKKYIPDVLRLKLGSLVMVLANRKQEVRDMTNRVISRKILYANGDLGILRDVDPGKFAFVELQRNGSIVEIPFHTDTWEVIKEEGKNIRRDKVGAVRYMPLRAAWGCTTHKTQSLTLDSVQVDFRNSFFTHPGMLYVALSRARTKEGLRLVGTPEQFISRCKVDPRVRRWA